MASAWDTKQSARATRVVPITLAYEFAKTFPRLVSWQGQECEPQPVTICIDPRITAYGNGETLMIPAGAYTDYPDDAIIVGRVHVRYGWGAFGSQFVMDLRPGTFILPACDACEVGFEIVQLGGGRDEENNGRPRPEQEIGKVSLAILPYKSGPFDPVTYTYRIPVDSREDGDFRLTGVEAPTRAVAYRAWLTEPENTLYRERPEILQTIGRYSEPREWRPETAQTEATNGSQFGETITATIRNAQGNRQYLATIQFRLSP